MPCCKHFHMGYRNFSQERLFCSMSFLQDSVLLNQHNYSDDFNSGPLLLRGDTSVLLEGIRLEVILLFSWKE